MRRLLGLLLALLPGTRGDNATAEGLLASYAASYGRCPHGQAGVIIQLLDATHPSKFKEALDAVSSAEHKAANVFHKDYAHINAFAMRAIHPATLLAVARHAHTQHIEASCIIRKTLPEQLSESGMSILFDGRYRSASASANSCEHHVNVSHPFSTRSYAFVHIRQPPSGAADCSSDYQQADTFNVHRAAVHMVRAHVGQITMVDVNGVTRNGTYVVNANGRTSDSIEWSDGSVWSKLAGPAYDRNSSIGPLEHMGTRVRNPQAQVRWNWGPDRIDGPETALNDTYRIGVATGEGTTLYNLDTGVMITHDDFNGRAVVGWSAGCPTGYERACSNGWAQGGVIDESVMSRKGGCSGHGTHTSSTAAGSRYGVANGAMIVPVQVLSCEGSADDSMLLDGMVWALEHALNAVPRRPSVIAMSLGGETRSLAIDKMVRRATELGVLVVAAAGNEGQDACGGSPAGAPEALTVGATGMAEPVIGSFVSANGAWVNPDQLPPTYDTVASFSDFGSCVDIFAPGVELLAAVADRDSSHYTSIMSGTSMAAPMAAGAALQILGLNPTFRPEDVTRALLCACITDGITGLDPYTRNCMLQGGAQLRTNTELAALIAAQQAPPLPPGANETIPTRSATQCYDPTAGAAAAESGGRMRRRRHSGRDAALLPN